MKELIALTSKYNLFEVEDKKIHDEHFEIAYDKVYKSPFESKEELQNWAKEVIESGRYSKSLYSLELLTIRTQIQIHGVVPKNYSYTQMDTWFGHPYHKLRNYIIKRGHYDQEDLYDPIKVVDRAKNHSLSRIEKSGGKAVTPNKAEKAVKVEYNKLYKDVISKADFDKMRVDIVDNVMHGVDVHVAFNTAFPNIKQLRKDRLDQMRKNLQNEKNQAGKDRKFQIIDKLINDYLKTSSAFFSPQHKTKVANILRKKDTVTSADVRQTFQNMKK